MYGEGGNAELFWWSKTFVSMRGRVAKVTDFIQILRFFESILDNSDICWENSNFPLTILHVPILSEHPMIYMILFLLAAYRMVVFTVIN